jgi:hypothetical protein
MYTWNFKFLQSILFKEQTSDRPWWENFSLAKKS